ncbi:MAG: response regulator transcription factor [Pseudomonadota bacterium]
MSNTTATNAESPRLRVIVADDHTLMREGVAAVIARQPDMTVVAEASDGEQALKAVEELKPDVLLLDLRMPKLDGLAVTARLHPRFPELAIVILSTYDTDDDILRALRAGARAYLLKDTSPEELAECVRAAHSGRSYVSSAVGAKLAAQATQTTLTFRELDVIKLIARGFLNKEIADQLHVSEGTVKSHTSTLFQKLAVTNRTEAVREAVKRGLVRLE